jgi:hypothetical protein
MLSSKKRHHNDVTSNDNDNDIIPAKISKDNEHGIPNYHSCGK